MLFVVKVVLLVIWLLGFSVLIFGFILIILFENLWFKISGVIVLVYWFLNVWILVL